MVSFNADPFHSQAWVKGINGIFIGIFRFIIEKMFSKYFAIGAIRLVLIMALMPIIIIYFGKLIGFWEIRIFPEDTLLEQMWMAFALVFLGYQSLLLSFIENGKVYSSFRMLAALGISVSVLSLIYAVGDLNGASAYRNSKRLNCIQEARSDCTSILVLGNKLSVVVQNGDIFLLKTDSIDRVSLPEPKSLGSIWTSFGD